MHTAKVKPEQSPWQLLLRGPSIIDPQLRSTVVSSSSTLQNIHRTEKHAGVYTKHYGFPSNVQFKWPQLPWATVPRLSPLTPFHLPFGVQHGI
jgi:hypothetical protein